MIKNITLALIVLAATSAFATDVSAVSRRVREACKDDYRAHCSAFDVGTPEVRTCMRAIKTKLSKACRTALVEDGEATEADIRSYRAHKSKSHD